MKNLISAACICTCLFVPASSMAKDFAMNHGKWEFTTTMTMPMFPQPQVTTMTECITEEEAKQDPMSDLVDDGNCTILNRTMSGSNLSFEMECNEEGMITRGKGQFTSKGDTASGFIEMIMDIPEMPGMPAGPMKMKTNWEGKRIGSCE